MRIIFFGTPEFSADFLRALLADTEMSVVGVVTQPDEPQGRKKILTPPPTKVLALEHHIPVFQPTKLKDPTFAESLAALKADVFLVIAYGRIIPQAVLDIPPLGCVNVHPSLLPKLRGPSPIISAIAQGERETGITIMKLDADMDHGPILAQTSFPLPADETTTSLTQKVVGYGVPLLIDTLKDYATGTIVPREQNHGDATFCKLLTREDGRVNWKTLAEVIDAQIRAFNPWPGTWTVWHRNGEDVMLKIHAAHMGSECLPAGVVHIQPRRIMIGTGTTVLIIDELQPAGGNRMPAEAFIQGYRDIDGATLG